MEFFLDKDIIFRYARRIVFAHKMPKKQFDLIEEILSGKHTVHVSNNTPFAVLNYIKYRVQDERGLNKPLEEADRVAKSIYSKIFGKGKWNLVNLSWEDYENACKDRVHEWEDAVQYQCVLKIGKPFATDNIRDFEKDNAIKLMVVR